MPNRLLPIVAFALSILLPDLSAAAQPSTSVSARLASCDEATMRAAVDEMLRDPKTLQEPLMLFHAASAMRMAGHKAEAEFLYLAARLRTSRQILFEKGDRPQLLAIMNMTVGSFVMPGLMADPEMAQRAVQRVLEWDRVMSDPFREREAAKSDEMQTSLAKIDAGLARLPDQVREDPARIEKARLEEEQAERMIKASRDERCGPGTLDAVDAEAVKERIKKQALSLVRTHPSVLSRADGGVKFVDVGAWQEGPARLPTRLTMSVTPVAGETFFAEVDAVVVITPERKLGSVRISLACLTKLWFGQREVSWRDVCAGDPAALKPSLSAAENARLDEEAERKALEKPVPKPVCGFPDLKLPEDFAVFVVGASSGRKIAFQIDQSGHEGTQIDVTVNSPNKPVVLLLGAYEPTIWNIGWTANTRILAVLGGGYHRQAYAGLEKHTPLLNSSHDNRGPCGYIRSAKDNLAQLNPLSRRVFGRPVDMVFPAADGRVVVGTALPAGAKLIRSPEVTPESFFDKSAPIAGPAGLEDAVKKGLLREATAADAEAWSEAVLQNSPKRDLPPVAGQGVPKPPKPFLYNAYVVLKPFTYPAGLYGGNSATFIIAKGVPKPQGDPGHSEVYDFNTLNCQGPVCDTR